MQIRITSQGQFEPSLFYMIHANGGARRSLILKKHCARQLQISRSLNRLVENGCLVKLGYGVYAKLERSRIAQSTYLKDGVLSTHR